MFIKRHITLIIILILIALVAAVFFVWLNRYERMLTQSYLQEQKEAAEDLNIRLENIRQEKIEEQQELSDTEFFIREYLN